MPKLSCECGSEAFEVETSSKHNGVIIRCTGCGDSALIQGTSIIEPAPSDDYGPEALGSSRNEPPDMVSQAEGFRRVTYTVYGLIDPVTRAIFYIGITKNTAEHRLRGHCTDVASSAYRRCRAIMKDGRKPETIVFAAGLQKTDAMILESRLVFMLPDICNDKKSGGISVSSTKHPNWKHLDYACLPQSLHAGIHEAVAESTEA